MRRNTDLNVFFTLLCAGLWEKGVRLSPFGEINFDEVLRIAEAQSVVGLVAAGLEHVEDRKVTKPQALPFLKKVFAIEGRNEGMNRFIADLFGCLREAGIHALLVKGQGVAQCYERPLWRSSGDVDLLLDEIDYNKAKLLLIPQASYVEKEYTDRMHLGLKLDSWFVELHGSMRNDRLGRVNSCIEVVQEDTFQKGRIRVWMNEGTEVQLPAADNDVIFVFAHILQHFFAGGIGLRQICDWCRLLWTYRNELDRNLLNSRLRAVHLWSEWEVFASLAVNYLGMPEEAIPFYRKRINLDRKADRLMRHILRTGNFGQNRDKSYHRKHSSLIRKILSFQRVTRDVIFQLGIFPIDSVVFYSHYVMSGSKSIIKGE